MRNYVSVLGACALAVFQSAALAQQSSEAWFSPYDDPEAQALAILDGAQREVSIAQYNIRNERFLEKLRELRARGVRVRIVVDAKNARNPWNTLDDRFEAEGFDILRYENTNSPMAIMHHKFTVVDDALVMTGSYNWNETAQLVNDENMVVVRDAAIVAGYQREFAELRGEAPEAPGPSTGTLGTVYFSPDDQVQRAIQRAIQQAQRKILVAVFTMNDSQIARALRDAARAGKEVIMVTERKQADTTDADETVASGGARVIVGANTSGAFSAMHHKFAVIDDEVVITGACNWTYTAYNHSNEDVLILRDPALARRYTQAFGALVHRYDPAGFDAARFGISASEAPAHFVVVHRNLPADGRHRIMITGDHPALGEWDPSRGLAVDTSEGLAPTWAARTVLPAGLRFEWKAVVMSDDGTVVWEPGSNQVGTTEPNGAPGVFRVDFEAGPLVDVTLEVRVPGGVPRDTQVRFTGNHPGLGAWSPDGAPQLSTDRARQVWRGRLALPEGTPVEWKAVLITPQGAVWEEGANRAEVVSAGATWSGEFRSAPVPGAAAPASGTPAPGSGGATTPGGGTSATTSGGGTSATTPGGGTSATTPGSGGSPAPSGGLVGGLPGSP